MASKKATKLKKGKKLEATKTLRKAGGNSGTAGSQY
jgi:hypothetical protein